MAKRNRGRRTVGTHWVKSKHDLAAAVCPTARLFSVVFAEKKGCEGGGAIHCQIQGEDSPRGVVRRCVALVSACQINLLAPDKVNRVSRWGIPSKGASGRNQPANR
jgi:hypothetical protein